MTQKLIVLGVELFLTDDPLNANHCGELTISKNLVVRLSVGQSPFGSRDICAGYTFLHTGSCVAVPGTHDSLSTACRALERAVLNEMRRMHEHELSIVHDLVRALGRLTTARLPASVVVFGETCMRADDEPHYMQSRRYTLPSYEGVTIHMRYDSDYAAYATIGNDDMTTSAHSDFTEGAQVAVDRLQPLILAEFAQIEKTLLKHAEDMKAAQEQARAAMGLQEEEQK